MRTPSTFSTYSRPANRCATGSQEPIGSLSSIGTETYLDKEQAEEERTPDLDKTIVAGRGRGVIPIGCM